MVEVQLPPFLVGGRLSQEGFGYRDVQHILDLDEKGSLHETVAKQYATALPSAMMVLFHTLDGAGQH